MPPPAPNANITHREEKGKNNEVIPVGEKKKMGRPYSDEVKKTGRFEIRTTPKEEEMLSYCCQKTGKSRADIIRMGLQRIYDDLSK